MEKMVESKNKNWKYWVSESASVGISIVFSASAAYLADKVTDSNAVISGVSALAGTAGWIIGTTGIYCGLHKKEYHSGERNLKEDIKNITKSNIEGIATNYAVRIPLQFALQKYANLSPPVAATISHVTGGIGAAAVRIARNYQRNIFGNKKSINIKESEKQDLENSANSPI